MGALQWGVSENNRKARYYSLTAASRRQLVAEAARWERMAAMIAGMLAGTEGA
jgi:PadR family transcriptional regulator, regulatory protein PadR